MPTCTLSHIIPLIQYYLWYWILTLITRFSNRGYILNHPDRTFPRAILHPSNTTIYSFTSQNYAMGHYLLDRNINISPDRMWAKPEILTHIFSGTRPPFPVIILDGDISGPRLRPGVFANQQGHLLYIKREVGRWPSQANLILAVAIDVLEDQELFIFIPDSLIDHTGVIDHHPFTPFHQTLSFPRFKRERRRFQIHSHDIV